MKYNGDVELIVGIKRTYVFKGGEMVDSFPMPKRGNREAKPHLTNRRI